MRPDIQHLRLGAVGAACIAAAACGNPPGEAQNQAQPPPQPNAPAMVKTPESIAREHREIHEVLAAATKEPGPMGEAARKLESLLAPHFQREEEIGTPPLGLLRPLASGQASADMRAVLPRREAVAIAADDGAVLHDHAIAEPAALTD